MWVVANHKKGTILPTPDASPKNTWQSPLKLICEYGWLNFLQSPKRINNSPTCEHFKNAYICKVF